MYVCVCELNQSNLSAAPQVMVDNSLDNLLRKKGSYDTLRNRILVTRNTCEKLWKHTADPASCNCATDSGPIEVPFTVLV